MTEVRSFDSFEEMQAFMAASEAAAMKALHPLQRALIPNPNFYWARAFPAGGCVIFGHFDKAGWLATEKELWEQEDEADREDWSWTTSHFDQREARGYKSGRAFSIIEPSGELGDTHVANMVPITQEAFEWAKSLRWDVMGRVTATGPLGKCIVDARMAGLDLG